tara:strand:+ start:816 stop:1895 length:1080 start_codon:yes stop_codon:yes gene_type:complete
MTEYKSAREEIAGTYSLAELEEIVEHGCASGCATNHIYYAETEKFFDDYKDEIIQHVTETLGEDFLKKTSNHNEGYLRGYKHDVAWTFIELVALEELDNANEGGQNARSYQPEGNKVFDYEDFLDPVKNVTKEIETEPENFKLYLRRGNAKAEAKDYIGAIDDIQKAIELNPKNEDLYYLSGEIKSKAGDHKSAIKDYTKAIEINPNDFHSFSKRAYAKNLLGSHQSALEDLNKAIEIDSGFPEPFYIRGLIKRKQGNHKEALEDYNLAMELVYEGIDIEPLNKSIMLGVIYNDEGEKEIAIKEYEKAIAIDTNNAEIFFNLGCDKQQSGDIKGACEDWKKAAKLGDEDAAKLLEEHCK